MRRVETSYILCCIEERVRRQQVARWSKGQKNVCLSLNEALFLYTISGGGAVHLRGHLTASVHASYINTNLLWTAVPPDKRSAAIPVHATEITPIPLEVNKWNNVS